MSSRAESRHSIFAYAIFGLLNPIPFGCFVAALVFDVVYARTGVVLWGKSAAWLIAIGLLFAIIPRVINLVQVWITSRRTVSWADKLDFWLNLFAIAAAIVNALVHSRDAYSAVPANVWLSACTVILLAVGRLVIVMKQLTAGDLVHG